MKKCYFCNEAYSDELSECIKCGAVLTESGHNSTNLSSQDEDYNSNEYSRSNEMEEFASTFCPKCSASMNENTICDSCGYDICESDSKLDSEMYQTSANNDGSIFTVKMVIFSLIAIVVLVMFFIAGGKISEGGDEIQQIRSIGGSTLEEAYYYELGSIYEGYAMIARALGVFFASVLVWLGLKK